MSTPLIRKNFEPPVQSVLESLYAEAVRIDPATRQQAERAGAVRDSDPGFYAAMRQAYMPVTPDFGMLLYLLARARGARAVVEFGTSFGLSTIFLAAALRDAGGGTVVTAELEPTKARQARANLAAAGLEGYVDIRTGDALDALRENLPERVDLLFLDGPKHLYLPVLQLVAPYLAGSSIIVSDNSEMESAADYLAHVNDPANGFIGCSLLTAALGNTYGHEVLMKG